jgi:hypothetical protein
VKRRGKPAHFLPCPEGSPEGENTGADLKLLLQKPILLSADMLRQVQAGKAPQAAVPGYGSMRCFLEDFHLGDLGDSGAEPTASRKDSRLTIQIYTPEMLWNQCIWRLRVSRKRNKCFSG